MAKVSKYGQWKYPGEDTIVPTPDGRITMKDVPYSVLGIDNQGNQQMMMPGGEYQFPGNSVYEIPMMKYGGDISIPNLRRVRIKALPKAQSTGQVSKEREEKIHKDVQRMAYNAAAQTSANWDPQGLNGAPEEMVVKDKETGKYYKSYYDAASGQWGRQEVIFEYKPKHYGLPAKNAPKKTKEQLANEKANKVNKKAKNDPTAWLAEHPDYVIGPDGTPIKRSMMEQADPEQLNKLDVQKAKEDFVKDLNSDPLQQSLGTASLDNPVTNAAAERYADYTVNNVDPGKTEDQMFRGYQAPTTRDFYQPHNASNTVRGAAGLGATAAGVAGLSAGLIYAPAALDAVYELGAASPYLQALGAGTRQLLSAAPKAVPWLNAGNALTYGFGVKGANAIATGQVAEPWRYANSTGRPIDYANAVAENLFTALEIAPFAGPLIKTGIQAAMPALRATGEFLTTQTPLRNTFKYNPWAWKPNPEAYYHRNPDFRNMINQETGMLQSWAESSAGKEYSRLAAMPKGSSTINLKRGANPGISFSKGTPLDGVYSTSKYPGPYLVEVSGETVPFRASVKGQAASDLPGKFIGSYNVPARPIALDEVKFYKEDWFRGYKPIETPKILPGSPNSNQYQIRGLTGPSTKTGLTEEDVAAAIEREKQWIQSDAYLTRRAANTGETFEQIKADVAKILSTAEDARFNLNANITPQGQMTPKSLFTRVPAVEVAKHAHNPRMVLDHETVHLYSPSIHGQTDAALHKGMLEADVASLPASERGVYANYPTLGKGFDKTGANINLGATENYLNLGYEQQARHLNARAEILKANGLPLEAELTEAEVKPVVDKWAERINKRSKDPQNTDLLKNEGDYDDLWLEEAFKIRENLLKEYGVAADSELNAAQTLEYRRRTKEELTKAITDVLNKAWVALPAGIGVGAAMEQKKRGGAVNAISKYKSTFNNKVNNNLPKAQSEGEVDYYTASKRLNDEQQRIAQMRNNVIPISLSHSASSDNKPFNVRLPEGQHYCTTRACEIEREAGFPINQVASGYKIMKETTPENGWYPTTYDKLLPGDIAQVVRNSGSGHTMVSTGDAYNMPELWYSPADRDPNLPREKGFFSDNGSGRDFDFMVPPSENELAHWMDNVKRMNYYTYKGNLPQYEKEYQQAAHNYLHDTSEGDYGPMAPIDAIPHKKQGGSLPQAQTGKNILYVYSKNDPQYIQYQKDLSHYNKQKSKFETLNDLVATFGTYDNYVAGFYDDANSLNNSSNYTTQYNYDPNLGYKFWWQNSTEPNYAFRKPNPVILEKESNPKAIDIKPLPTQPIDITPTLTKLPLPQTNKQRIIINTPQGDKIRVQDAKTKRFINWEDEKGLPSDVENPTGTPDDFKFAEGGELPKAQTEGQFSNPDFKPSWDWTQTAAENAELNRRAQAAGHNSVDEYRASGWAWQPEKAANNKGTGQGVLRAQPQTRNWEQQIMQGIPAAPPKAKSKTTTSSSSLKADLKKMNQDLISGSAPSDATSVRSRIPIHWVNNTAEGIKAIEAEWERVHQEEIAAEKERIKKKHEEYERKKQEYAKEHFGVDLAQLENYEKDDQGQWIPKTERTRQLEARANDFTLGYAAATEVDRKNNLPTVGEELTDLALELPFALLGTGAYSQAFKMLKGAKRAAPALGALAPETSILDDIIGKSIQEAGASNLNPTEVFIRNAQKNGIIPASANVKSLVDNPNLLNTVVTRGIKNNLTVARRVTPSAGAGVAESSMGTITPLATGDAAALSRFTGDPVGEAFHMGTHVPRTAYGQRSGLSDLGRDVDALYFDAPGNFAKQERVLPNQYGDFTVTSRIPFEYSSDPQSMYAKYMRMLQETKGMSGGTGAQPGDIFGKLHGFGAQESAIIGKPGQQVLEPISVSTISEYNKPLEEFDELLKLSKEDPEKFKAAFWEKYNSGQIARTKEEAGISDSQMFVEPLYGDIKNNPTINDLKFALRADAQNKQFALKGAAPIQKTNFSPLTTNFGNSAPVQLTGSQANRRLATAQKQFDVLNKRGYENLTPNELLDAFRLEHEIKTLSNPVKKQGGGKKKEKGFQVLTDANGKYVFVKT